MSNEIQKVDNQSPKKVSQNQDQFLFKEPEGYKLSPIREMKEKIISEYRKKNQSIVEKLERTAAGYNTDQLLTVIMEEILMTYEDALGNVLLLENNGDLSAASNVSFKRTELLKSVAEIASRKKELNQKNGEVDLNSPVFCTFQKICFEKMVLALQEVKMSPEMVNLFLSSWQDKMKNWDKELKAALKELESD